MKIAVILGSVRKGRKGERVAKLVMDRMSVQSGIEAELLDLKEYPLPFYDEDQSPDKITAPYQNETANKWAAKIAELDGFVVVAPEYNHGYSAVLKNAFDYLYSQWVDKPVTFVSYSSGMIGGARGVEQLRLMIVNLGLIGLSAATHIGKVSETIAEDGKVVSGPFEASIDKQLAQLIEWSAMLKEKRDKKK